MVVIVAFSIALFPCLTQIAIILDSLVADLYLVPGLLFGLTPELDFELITG